MLKYLSVAGFAVMVAGIVGLAYTDSLFRWTPVPLALQGLAVALMVWARLTFGRRSFHGAANPTAGGLVTSGPYRWIRHPIYTAACLFAWVGVATHLSPLSVALGLLTLAGGLVRMLCEERLVVAQYPEYAQYAAVTKRMIPFVF